MTSRISETTMNASVGSQDLACHRLPSIGANVGMSLLFHAFVALVSLTLVPWFPPRDYPAAMIVELSNPPMPHLLGSEHARPHESTPVISSAVTNLERDARPLPAPAPARWLERLDAGLAKMHEARIADKKGDRGSIAMRRWEEDADPRLGDVSPEGVREKIAPDRRSLVDLESRVRISGRPAVGAGEESEAITMFAGTGSSAGKPLPAGIREMIRRKVRGYLPELEAIYSDAIRRDRHLKGRLLIRFRIDPSGRVGHAEQAEKSFEDTSFGAAVLERVRRWKFEPTGGHTVEVLYPFVFVSPS
jgi:TonB family protein